MSPSLEFDAVPGQRVVPTGIPGVSLIYDGIPDWVRLPPELGGHQVNVRFGQWNNCPCKSGHISLVLCLDEPTGLKVAECPIRGYLWFRHVVD